MRRMPLLVIAVVVCATTAIVVYKSSTGENGRFREVSEVISNCNKNKDLTQCIRNLAAIKYISDNPKDLIFSSTNGSKGQVSLLDSAPVADTPLFRTSVDIKWQNGKITEATCKKMWDAL